MAEGNRDNENNFTFRNYSLKKEQNDSDDSDGTEESYVKPDLGIGNEPSFEKKTDNFAAANDLPKREDNPFSFKHFLRRETGNTYHNTGARPKVYSNSSSDSYSHLNTPDSDPGLYSPSPRNSTTPRLAGTPELTSVLPDFVQDHLVIEQSYLNHSDSPTSPHMCVNLDNLPDFALNSSFDNSGRSRLWDEPRSTVSQASSCDDHSPGLHVGRNETTPLDLPVSSNLPSFPVSPNRSRGSGLPFDLPLVVGDLDAQSGTRGQQLADVGVSKSLPDFLSDGPIHSSLLNDASQPCIESPDDTTNNSVGIHDIDHQRILNENERLKREVETSRRQMVDKTRRIQALEKELQSMRVKDQEEMATLEKAMEQVEDNLKRSTRRAVTAENTVSKLKQEMKSLMSELTSLRQSNRAYRQSEAGASTSHSYPLDDAQSRRIAGDLRLAASTAEQSLRTLLTGVSNLRDIASTIESINRIQDRTGDYEKDPDDDTGGPAL